eukprot:TRINITY_DN96741_c0_g1_i1.p1 TRINITY_DN96741_c0_g1~~TRINITY_DN96741_c0_g1_i1.p1  ORF type:complete len:360 (-),score=64.46 TRINITY_DN96741_c0_g1_i1:12-1091(-)
MRRVELRQGLRCHGRLLRQVVIITLYVALTRGPAILASPGRHVFISQGAGKQRTLEVSCGQGRPATSPQVPSLEMSDTLEASRYPESHLNTPILSTAFLMVTALVLRQDALAIFALWEFSDTMEANWILESVRLLLRLPSDLIQSYGEAATLQPIVTKAATSAVAYIIGDLMAQVFEGRRRIEWLDLPRCARNGAAGFILHGPALHFWILFLEGPFATFIGGTSEWWAIVAKVVMDQTIFAVTLNTAYALMLGALAAKPLGEVLQRTWATLAPAMLSSWRFWPFVHLVTYSPFMPIEFKVLWNDIAEIVWVAILSVIANDEKEAHPEQQKAVVLEDFGMEPAVEVMMAAEAEKQVSEKA